MLERVKFVHVLTLVAIAIASAIMFAVMLGDDFTDSELRTQVVTAALGILALAAGYWFNSSNESNRKTDLLAQSQPVDLK